MEKFENSLIIFVISRERGPKCLERIDPISVLSEDVMEHGTTSLEECQLLEAQLLSAGKTQTAS